MNTPQLSPAAGWYDSGDGRIRWFDGIRWTSHYQQPAAQPPHPYAAPISPPAPHTAGPMTGRSLNVKREVSYVRAQTGHSLLLHVLVIGLLCLWINVLYISLSPNHYWHA